jgi:ABC-type antimicrobial peptide transport system permease subunit
MHESIDPIIFLCNGTWGNRAFLRLNSADVKQVIAQVEELHNKINPEYPFAYTFLEEDFEKLYNNEKVTGSLALGFTIMAIIISGLGLLGLAAYTSEKRKKEISIRKTLGASVSGIVSMISKDFTQLSLWAAIVGCPVSYFLMDQFLQSYAYHTDLTWEIFLYTAIGVILLTVLTVIFQVTRAAVANPVNALRNE